MKRRKMPVEFAAADCAVVLATVIGYQVMLWNSPGKQFRRAIEVEHVSYSSDEYCDHGHIVKGRIKNVSGGVRRNSLRIEPWIPVPSMSPWKKVFS